MKILVLKGSPRLRGNSSVLADQIAAGATHAGAEVECVFLAGLDIRPCDGCDGCRGSGACAIEDDMKPLYTKLLEADGLVLASPIYWFTYSAQLKLCIDRWYALFNNEPYAFKGKPVAFALAYGDSDIYTSGAVNAIHTFESMFNFLQSKIVGWVYGTLNDIGDAQKQPELMQQAYELGEKLVG
jgi:multimeric flavodoxin WrbA